MKKIAFLIAVCASVLAILPSSANAGWKWRRVQTNCGYTYQRYYVQEVAQPQVQNTTTVVNNLIGIPVPVNYTEPITAQGSTVYGYSSVTQAQGALDMGLLYNQAARLTDQAQQLAGQAATDFAALVQAEGQNRAEVAKIIAQGQAARMALEATQGHPPQLIQRTFAFRVTQGADGQMKVEQIQSQQPQDFSLMSSSATNVSDLLKQRCVSCHGNAKASGNLNLEVAISDAQQRAILERVTTEDHARRMPRNPDGTAGAKLSIDELRLLFNAMAPATSGNTSGSSQ